MKNIKEILLNKISSVVAKINPVSNETIALAIGSMLSKQQLLISSTDINEFEFKIFSQFGEDGMIQYLIKHVKVENKIFIEFGVENYQESNTRFLMMNNNWQGFVMDGSYTAIKSLKSRNWYWKYNLTGKAVFIDKNNINELLVNTGLSNIGLLSIDLDGNDYHIFKEIDLSKINPSIIVLEYNSVFGKDRLITVPYDKYFNRTKAHYSNLFFGASLSALNYLALKKGYSLVGCNIAGTNAFFVRKDLLNENVKELTSEIAFKESQTRESRDTDYSLSFIAGKERLELIKGLEVLNILTETKEKL
jgi:hypothetical protein